MIIEVADAPAMERLGGELASYCPKGSLIYLQGELGAGKTTWVRGFLRSFGYTGNVKSPTYTLVESYQFNGRQFYHFDLYRLEDPQELENIGLRDYLDGQGICLVEWPEKARGVLVSPDLWLKINYLQVQRRVEIEALSNQGSACLEQFSQNSV
jgi:tRNA threonylcarbamoyladenosine biosynthesis protein TsaE